jgi:hypothetical protein
MTLSEFTNCLMKPILFGNKIIYITEFRTDLSIRYLSMREYEKYLKFNIIPDKSIEDRTYKSLGERLNLSPPKYTYIQISNKQLKAMKYL